MAAGAAASLMEMVVAAAVQEVVTRGTSFVISKLTEKADVASASDDNIERAETAHAKVELVLERSAKLPITDRAMLRGMKKLKRAYEECSDWLQRCKQPRGAAVEDDNQATRSSSLPRRVVCATKSLLTSYFAKDDGDGLSSRDVQRFELAAAFADRLMSDLETGATLRQYMFFSPLIRQLVDGHSTLRYKTEQGGRTRDLFIWPVRLEERGVEAMLVYCYQDLAVPGRSFYLRLMLRLSESTDVVGTILRCLRRLFTAPQLKPLAEAAMGELCQLPTQDVAESCEPPLVQIQEFHVSSTWLLRPDPLCCKPNSTTSTTTTTTTTTTSSSISSELTQRFPEQVISVFFSCSVPWGFDGEAGRNNRSILDIGLPHLEVSVMIEPHWTPEDMQASTVARETIVGTEEERVQHADVGLQQVEEMVLPKAMDHFSSRAETTAYSAWWYSAHGSASFWARKTGTE